MLSQAALAVADRLATALMAALEALNQKFGVAAPVPVVSRIAELVLLCLNLSAFGPPKPRAPQPTPSKTSPEAPSDTPPDTPPEPPADAPTAPSPSRLTALPPPEPGWLLATLPDSAPAIAAELSALLADPATAELLDASPALRRLLKPVLCLLGLDQHGHPAPPSAAPLPPTPAPPAHPLIARPRPAPPPSPHLQPA